MRFKQYYLNEASGEDIYKFYNNIPRDQYNKIVIADPTSIFKDNEIKKVGKYSKWLLNLFKVKKFKIEDLYKATEDLKIFDKNITKVPVEKRDVNRFKDLADLHMVVEPLSGIKTKGDTEKEYDLKKTEYDTYYEDSTCVVYIPKTEEASCSLGNGTQWCTAARSEDNRFKDYSEQGDLYILIDKKDPSKKYQLHFESKQYMDKNDKEVNLSFFKDNYKGFFDHVTKKIIKEIPEIFNEYTAGSRFFSEEKDVFNSFKGSKEFIKAFVDKFYSEKSLKQELNTGERLYTALSNIPKEILDESSVTSQIKSLVDSYLKKFNINSSKGVEDFIDDISTAFYKLGVMWISNQDLMEYVKRETSDKIEKSIEYAIKNNIYGYKKLPNIIRNLYTVEKRIAYKPIINDYEKYIEKVIDLIIEETGITKDNVSDIYDLFINYPKDFDSFIESYLKKKLNF